MADFEKRVNIEIDLSANVAGAVAKLNSTMSGLKATAEGMEDDLQRAENAINDFDPDRDADVDIGGRVDSDSIHAAVTNARLQANRFASEVGGPRIPIGAKLEEFEVPEEIAEEISELNDLKESAEAAGEEKENVAHFNDLMGDSAEDSSKKLDMETRSARQLFDELDGDGLEEAKHAVKNANNKLSGSADETARAIARESDSAEVTEGRMRRLTGAKDEASDSSRKLARTLRRARGATDEVGDSMRAAHQIGEVFEDGMGNLSVNVGAFTIALRNFLTQIPLMIGALGALGVAAAGAATAFVALAGAMGIALGAGAVAHAQEIAESNKDIEETAEALQNIMQNLQATFAEAFAPLLENEDIVNVFKDAISGFAGVMQQMAESINRLMDSSGELEDGVLSIQGVMGQLRKEVGDDLHRVMLELEEAFKDLQDDFIFGMEVMVGGTADLIDRSRELFMGIEDLSGAIGQMTDTISEMAEVGINVGGGLVPVFEAVSSVFEGLASALNKVEDETLENAVTFLVIIATVNKFGAVLASVISLIPNVLVGFAAITGAASRAEGEMNSLRAAIFETSAVFGGFLRNVSGLFGGLTALVEVIEEFEQRMRRVVLSTAGAEQTLDRFVEGALRASAGLEFTANEAEELTDELQQLMVQGQLTDAQLSKLGVGEVMDADDVDQRVFGSGTGGGFVTGSAISQSDILPDDTIEGVRSKLSRLRPSQSLRSSLKSFGAMYVGVLGSIVNAYRRAIIWTGNFIAASNAQRMEMLRTIGVTSALASVNTSLRNTKAALVGWYMKEIVAQEASNANKLVAIGRTIRLALAGELETVSKLNVAGASWTAAAAELAYASAALVAAGATMVLDLAITILTGGLNKALFAVVALIGVIGGLAVGIITNLGAIKGAAAGVFGFIVDIINVVVDILITYFIQVWNLMVDLFVAAWIAIRPLVDIIIMLAGAFDLLGGSGENAEGGIDWIGATVAAIKGLIIGLTDALGGLFKIIGGIINIFFTLIKIALLPVIALLDLLYSIIVGALQIAFDFLFGWLSDSGDGFKGLMEIIDATVEFFYWLGQAIIDITEMAINAVIEMVNWIIAGFNMIPGVSIPKLDKIDFGMGEAAKAERDDLTNDGTQDEEQEGKIPPRVEYREDNSTNIDQQVDADPEDQAQLSRVVTDAIEEANSFARRQQGGQ